MKITLETVLPGRKIPIEVIAESNNKTELLQQLVRDLERTAGREYSEKVTRWFEQQTTPAQATEYNIPNGGYWDRWNFSE